MNDVTNTEHGGADVRDSVPLTFADAMFAMDKWHLEGNLPHGYDLDEAWEALRPHLAKAGGPVAEVVEWEEDDGTSKHVVSFLCPLAELPVGAKLYAAPPSAKRAQPVEAVGVASALRFAADVIELYDDATTCDDYMISATDAAAVVRVLAEHAALAHPCPSGAGIGTHAVIAEIAEAVKADKYVSDTDLASGVFGPAMHAFARKIADEYLSRPTTSMAESHPDDLAVDAFASAMKAKLALARAKGRGGWNDDEPGMQQRLSKMLRDHVQKGDPRDVANFAMFLHQRGESILPAPTFEQAGEVDDGVRVFSFDGGWLFEIDRLSLTVWDAEHDPDADVATVVLRECAKSLAQPRPVGVPDGWKLVPVRITYAICEAMRDHCTEDMEDIWNAAIAAAPAPGKGGEA